MIVELKQAIKLRSNQREKEALCIFKELLNEFPNSPIVHYQIAWTYDLMGNESDAVGFYVAAINHGLSGEDLREAYTGLGSTYRCLGEYQKSLDIFNLALTKFPNDRSIKIFRALTLYNLGEFSQSVETLLIQLLETTSDINIKTYEKALRVYSRNLDRRFL